MGLPRNILCQKGHWSKQYQVQGPEERGNFIIHVQEQKQVSPVADGTRLPNSAADAHS